MAVVLTKEGEVLDALRRKHAGDEWVFLDHLKTATGWQTGRGRETDGWAMNMWPSRGLKTHGFEVKVSRSDWLAELKDPSKADESFQFCDFWWVAAGASGVVRKEELPAGWGLMVPHRDSMRIAVQAADHEADFDRAFFASCLRNLQRATLVEKERLAIEDREYRRGYNDGAKAREKQAEAEVESAKHLADKTLESVREFERLTGVQISTYRGQAKNQAKIFKAVEALLRGDYGGRVEGRLQSLRDQLAKSLTQFDTALAEMKALGDEIEEKGS